jgi:peptidoglycan/LPS O-acetylase OafA/YrhL
MKRCDLGSLMSVVFTERFTQPAHQPEPRTIPSLDGLRAVSILLVVISHSAGFDRHSFVLRLLFSHGELGVRIFFIISGYLITTLLLNELADYGNISLRLFYIRRGLRILPAFYLFVSFVIVLDRYSASFLSRVDIVRTLTYTVNFSYSSNWWIGHLWSLSVEEQFYLLWPLAIGRLRMRTCVIIAIFTVFAGIIIRAIYATTGLQILDPNLRYAFPFVAGPLAMGCLLAMAGRQAHNILRYCGLLSGYRALALIPVILILDVLDVHVGSLNRVLAVLTNILVTACVARFLFTPCDSAGRLLNCRPLVFIGKLSYSLYLWQQVFFNPLSTMAFCRFPLSLSGTVAAASASYLLVERPMLGLRRRFRRNVLVAPTPTCVVYEC